ncbi:MAG TPA: hypothetical protein VGP66_06040 [Candidatus Acidoferrum sp.]|nr:hypothetical protein [Candidatus Acidoferrum sp.]
MATGKSGQLQVPAGRRRYLLAWLLVTLLGTGGPTSDASAGLPVPREGTLHGYHDYVSKVEARNQEGLNRRAFLWIDELPEPERTRAYERLKQGGVMMKRIGKDEADGAAKVSGGMIHDWESVIFIPGTKLDQVLGVLQDYNKHSQYYAPDVESAKIESRDGDHFRVYMRFRRKKIVTVVLNTEQDVRYFRDSTTRELSRSSAVRIREVANPGTKEEREKSPEEENGFLWQMETWWRMEERDGGVYVQNEAVTLTRDIPAGLGWLIGPFVTSIPKETLEFTMSSTREAVLAQGKR